MRVGARVKAVGRAGQADLEELPLLGKLVEVAVDGAEADVRLPLAPHRVDGVRPSGCTGCSITAWRISSRCLEYFIGSNPYRLFLIMIMVTEYYYSRAGRFCQPHLTKFRGKKKAARPSREEGGKPPPAAAGGGFRVLFGNRVEHELVRGGDLFVVAGEGHVEVRLRQLGGDEADERGDDEGGRRSRSRPPRSAR